MATDPARPEQSTPPPVDPIGGPPQAPPEKKHHSRWIWVSGLLVLVVAGLLVWALSLQSDLDDANAKNEQAAQTGSTIAGAAKDAYDELASELGSTSEDLANTEQQLEDTQKQADDAQKQADEAQQKAENTNDELEKAQAEADQAKAEADAAGSKAKIAAECAKAYISAAGGLLSGEDRESVKSKLQGITDQCQAAFSEAQAE